MTRMLFNRPAKVFHHAIATACFTSLVFMLSAVFSPFLAATAYAAAPGYPGITPAPLVDIREVINVEGPDNTRAVASVPTGPLEAKTSAADAASVNYKIGDTAFIAASVLGIVTVNKPYVHSFQNCNRFNGYTLDDARTVGMPDLAAGGGDVPQFWYIEMSKKGVREKTFTFFVFVNEAEKTFTVDSFWLPEEYKKPQDFSYNYIFNMQIVAISQQDASDLLHGVMSKLANYNGGWQVRYANTQAVKPPFLINSADCTRLVIRNMLPQSLQAKISCVIRYPDNKEKTIDWSSEQSLAPGDNVISLPLAASLDANLYARAEGFLDEVYVGHGYWFAFDTSGKHITKTDTQTPGVGARQLFHDDFPLGSAGIRGSLPANGRGGLARTLNPNSLAVDISGYRYLSFMARGSGESYSVQLETEAVRNKGSNDFHQYVITPGAEWRQYNIPLSDFKQLGTDPGKAAPFTGRDVISVAWQAMGAPLNSLSLEVWNAAFNNDPGRMSIVLTIGSPEISVNGKAQEIDPGYQTAPAIVSGRTFIPARAVVEALGGTVAWDGQARKATITLKDIGVVLVIGKKNASVNGVSKALEAAPYISGTGRTMLPLRFIAENLGHTVSWDGDSRSVSIQ